MQYEFLGKIIEITDTEVVMRVILDIEKRVTQPRRFKKSVFPSTVFLDKGEIIMIKINQPTPADAPAFEYYNVKVGPEIEKIFSDYIDYNPREVQGFMLQISLRTMKETVYADDKN